MTNAGSYPPSHNVLSALQSRVAKTFGTFPPATSWSKKPFVPGASFALPLKPMRPAGGLDPHVPTKNWFSWAMATNFTRAISGDVARPTQSS